MSIPIKNLHRSVVDFVLDNIKMLLRNQLKGIFLGKTAVKFYFCS